MNTIKFTGRTEEDAVRKAAATFSIPEKDVQYKIVSRSSGLLSMLGQSVTIEVTLGERGEPVAPAPRHKPAEPAYEAPVPPETDDGDDEAQGEVIAAGTDDVPPPLPETPRTEQPRSGERGESPRQRHGSDRPRGGERSRDRSRGHDRSRRPEHGHDRPRSPRPDQAQRPPRREAEADGDEVMETRVVDEEVFARKLDHAKTLLTDMVKLIGGEAQISAARKDAQIEISITGQLPDWMGRGHSRALEALQFVANKIVNRFPPRHRVVLLREGQQDERLNQIEAAAAELARKVSETGQTLWIVPMNARERRMVHMAVAAVPGLATRSVGDGPGRRLCIYRESAPEAPAAD